MSSKCERCGVELRDGRERYYADAYDGTIEHTAERCAERLVEKLREDEATYKLVHNSLADRVRAAESRVAELEGKLERARELLARGRKLFSLTDLHDNSQWAIRHQWTSDVVRALAALDTTGGER